MLSGALGMDQIAELIELEVGSYHTAYISTQWCAYIPLNRCDVRSSPKSGHQLSTLRCPLWIKSGHC
jgi:hypothetical protein